MPKAPASYKEAMPSPHADQWRAAIDEHLAGHARLHMFEETIIPSHRRTIPGKWVFALKTSPTGQIERFKARFVIQGFRQRQGLDFNGVFYRGSTPSKLDSLSLSRPSGRVIPAAPPTAIWEYR
jgi:hypothetical protein